MVYGNQRLLDEHGRLRLDAREMEASIQKETLSLMNKHDNESIFALPGTTMFINEFYRIHGFRVLPDDNIEVDLNQLALLQPK
jgi:enoyl-[acyl-carrier protein] reductase/trans-2-enoyl-CoA reductase (NAD+)